MSAKTVSSRKKRKKDFKLSENVVVEFERYAPSGQQTSIVETLMVGWIEEQRRRERAEEVRRAYERIANA